MFGSAVQRFLWKRRAPRVVAARLRSAVGHRHMEVRESLPDGLEVVRKPRKTGVLHQDPLPCVDKGGAFGEREKRVSEGV